ncbi:MAG: MBL fold metallo-hydrolase [Planctomycetota bacterium]|jgi:hypothetical protein
MEEILPDVFHWVATHPKIKIPVSSYYLAAERVLIDPMVPAEGLSWFQQPAVDAPAHALLTNRHHFRDCGAFVERYGCEIWCVEQGVHEFTSGEQVTPFRFGDELPGHLQAVEVGALCPDETALHIPRGEGMLAVADGVVRDGDGPLSFVPDEYMGPDPEAVKAGLRESYERLLERDFDHLLLAHGNPWVGGGKAALQAFLAG